MLLPGSREKARSRCAQPQESRFKETTSRSLDKIEDKPASQSDPSAGQLAADASAAPLKYYITTEELAALDEETRAHYFSLGDDYRIKPEVTNKRQEKIALVVLFLLAVSFAAIGLYGYVIDSLQLQIFGFCGAMPTFLGFLIHLMMAMSSLD
jgi:hypothetical protein